jgi:hypothetical protein
VVQLSLHYTPSCSLQRYSTSRYLLSGGPRPLTLSQTLSPVTISKDLLIWGTKITITSFATQNHKPRSQSYTRSYNPSAQTLLLRYQHLHNALHQTPTTSTNRRAHMGSTESYLISSILSTLLTRNIRPPAPRRRFSDSLPPILKKRPIRQRTAIYLPSPQGSEIPQSQPSTISSNDPARSVLHPYSIPSRNSIIRSKS